MLRSHGREEIHLGPDPQGLAYPEHRSRRAGLQALASGLWMKKRAREGKSFQCSSCGWSQDSHRRIRKCPGASRAAGQASPR